MLRERWNINQRKEYDRKMSKKGAKKTIKAGMIDYKTGEVLEKDKTYLVSDFKRGQHFERARQITKAQINTYAKHHPESKLEYYKGRVNDMSLSDGQRKYAEKQVKKLSS